jgi:N-acyl homoserine lactone hydrolase
VRLRLGDRDVVLAGDSCYLAEWIDSEETSPIVGHEKEAERSSLRRLRALRDGGARILVGHDPGQWVRVAQGPLPVDPGVL